MVLKAAKDLLYLLQELLLVKSQKLQTLNVVSVDVRLKGLGPGRRKITKILKDYNISITSLQDVTPLPFNGTRLRRKRRI